MFNILSENKHQKKHWHKIGDRVKVKSAAVLLSDKQYRFYIEQIKELSLLPEEHFNHFYQSFIQRFAEFVQLIPETPDAQLGSFLANGLLRGINTLHLFVTKFDKPSPLERYALFTACVLRHISNILTGQKIYLTDKTGAMVKLWQPFCGPMTEEVEGDSYKIFPMRQVYERISKSVRVTLARQVLGENGFLWLASDLRLFAEWLEALLEEEEEGTGRLIKVIKIYRKSGNDLIDMLPLSEIEILDSPETEYADKFYEWLIDGLQNGKIKVNTSDANVHITNAGVFIETPGIFKDFAKLHNVPVNHFVVFTQFGNLIGIARKGGHDYKYAQLFSDYPDTSAAGSLPSFTNPLSSKGHKIRDGILISDINSVYTKKSAPETSPHIKLPSTLKPSHQQLAQFNEAMNPNNALKNK